MRRIPIFVPRTPIILQEVEYESISSYGYIYLTADTERHKFYIGKKEKNKFDEKYFGSGLFIERIKNKRPETLSSKPIQWLDSKESLNNAEKWWIDFLEALIDVEKPVSERVFYNILAGGDGGKLTGESLEKMKKSMKGKMVGKKNPNFQGKSMTPEHYKKHSEFMKNKRVSPKTEFSSENSSGGKNSQARPVVQLTIYGELIKTYDYLSEAHKYGFVSDENLRKCCKHRNGKSTYRGFRWMYKEDYDKLTEKDFEEMQNISEEDKKRLLKSSFNPSARSVVKLSLDDKLICEYEKIQHAINEGYGYKYIRLCCIGEHQSYQGFKWMYKEDYEKMIKGGDN